MQNRQLLYTDEALKQLKKLDKSVALRIVRKIESYTSSSDPLKGAKQLTGTLEGLYRYRIGDYRAIFEVDKKGKLVLLTILYIGHRKEVYR